MRKRYPKEGLKAGLTKEDLGVIDLVDNCDNSKFNDLCSEFDVTCDSQIEEVAKNEKLNGESELLQIYVEYQKRFVSFPQ